MMDDNGWEKYQKQVLSELATVHTDIKAIETAVVDLRVEMSALKVKAGVWGAIAGAIPALLAVGAVLLHHFAGG